MNKTFTTSAQKTIALSTNKILKLLNDHFTAETGLTFKETARKNILEAKMKDGSKLIIAAFEKENGKSLAMVDHKDLPNSNNRTAIQRGLRKTLDGIFQ